MKKSFVLFICLFLISCEKKIIYDIGFIIDDYQLKHQILEEYLLSFNNDKVEYRISYEKEINEQKDGYIIDSNKLVIEKCVKHDQLCLFMNKISLNNFNGKTSFVGYDINHGLRMQGEILASLKDKGDINQDGLLQIKQFDNNYEAINQYIIQSGLFVEEVSIKEAEAIICNQNIACMQMDLEVFRVGVSDNNYNLTGIVSKNENHQIDKVLEVLIDGLNGNEIMPNYRIDYVKFIKYE